MPDRKGRQFLRVLQLEFAHHIVSMIPDGSLAEPKPPGQHSIGGPFRDASQHLLLPTAQ